MAESCQTFMDIFKWERSLISGTDKEQLEETIVKDGDIFARHRLDIGINNNFKVTLTPKDEPQSTRKTYQYQST